MKDGILNVNKPQNMTSHDVVRDLRRILGMKKIGHTGTLDPMATGVLPICLGSATRITEYLDLDFKTYRCTMKLGLITDTQDIWGEVLECFPTEQISKEQIKSAFKGFYGSIDQKPPMYSAVRVNGKRLYEYARAGETVEVKSRKVFIRELNIEHIDLNSMEVIFTVICSKGTYIRTICQDVGFLLGTGAVMTDLVRLASGSFTLEKSIDLEQLKQMNQQEINSLILPIEYPLVHFGKAVMSPELGKKFTDGWHIGMYECRIERQPEFQTSEFPLEIRPEYRQAYNMYREDNESPTGETFLGVAFYHKQYKKLVADKVFIRRQENESI